MKLSDHIAECMKKLGNPYEEVHKWLDRFAWMADGSFDPNHREYLHNEDGIETIRAKWGDKAAEAARLHIISDLKMEGLKKGDPIPKDSREYRRRFPTSVTLHELQDLAKWGFVKIE